MEYAHLACEQAVVRAAPAADAVCPPRLAAWVLSATILGSSMTFIDSTAVNVVLPLLGEQLGAGATALQWIVEGYMLLLTSLILLGGSLGDRYGSRRLFIVGTSLFALASAACGLAPDVTRLIVSRAVQGVGAALLVPGSLALISATFGERERGAAIGTWAAGTSIAAGAGPVIGSWLVQQYSWRWVFLINLPLAAVVIWIALTQLPERGGTGRATRLDWRGATLATTGLGALVFGLVRASGARTGDAVAVGAMLLGVLLLSGFLLTERDLERRPSTGIAPMMPLSLFHSRTFTGTNLLTLFLYAALAMATFVLPFTLIERHGYTVVGAASALLPFVVVMFTLSRWAGRLLDRYGPRLPLVAGPLVAATGYLAMTRVSEHGRYLTAVLPAILLMSAGMAISVAPLTATVLASVDAAHAGIASGVNNAVSRLASLLAVALVGFLSAGHFAGALGRTALLAALLALTAAASAAALVGKGGMRPV